MTSNTENFHIHRRLELIEQKIDRVFLALSLQEEEDWLTTAQAIKLMGISERQMRRLVSKGVIHGQAICNIGAGRTPRYRYHRKKMMNQWLKRPLCPA